MRRANVVKTGAATFTMPAGRIANCSCRPYGEPHPNRRAHASRGVADGDLNPPDGGPYAQPAGTLHTTGLDGTVAHWSARVPVTQEWYVLGLIGGWLQETRGAARRLSCATPVVVSSSETCWAAPMRHESSSLEISSCVGIGSNMQRQSLSIFMPW